MIRFHIIVIYVAVELSIADTWVGSWALQFLWIQGKIPQYLVEKEKLWEYPENLVYISNNTREIKKMTDALTPQHPPKLGGQTILEIAYKQDHSTGKG